MDAEARWPLVLGSPELCPLSSYVTLDNFITSLGLSVLTCKMGAVIVPLL